MRDRRLQPGMQVPQPAGGRPPFRGQCPQVVLIGVGKSFTGQYEEQPGDLFADFHRHDRLL
jgi:hypothetical protein